MSPLEQRLAWLLLNRLTFTADDVTDAGNITLDAGHGANGKQNGIGKFIQQAARNHLIVATGQVVRSRAPHRKGGAIRVWEPTDTGRRWAQGALQPERTPS